MSIAQSEGEVRPSPYNALDRETRPTIDTATAAFYLSRKARTLNKWAVYGGPLSPVRINKRLAWSVAEIRSLLAGDGQ